MGIHPQLANVGLAVYGDLAVGRDVILSNHPALYHKKLRGQIAPKPRIVKMVDLTGHYWNPSTGLIENDYSTARSTFARMWGHADRDARTRFVIADQPQTNVWAFTLSSRTSIWRLSAIWPSVEYLFSITPLPWPVD
jgi:hypothetical protein